METNELMNIISRGEDSRHQFKADMRNPNSMAAEIVAFSNSEGGMLIIGVTDKGEPAGLSGDDMRRLNQLVSNAATQHVKPPVNPVTENVSFKEGLVMVVTVFPGISKPYMDNTGAVWVKNGSDKRKVTSREEMQRMYQRSGLVHADEIPVRDFTTKEVDIDYFSRFFEKEFGERMDDQSVSLSVLLENMNLARDSVFNLAGALLFAKKPHFRLPVFIVKAVRYPGEDIDVDEYIDSRDITGKLTDLYHNSLGFIMDHLRRFQGVQSVNSLGEYEIPRIALEELLVNALIHRDYFVSAPIRIFFFSNRIEIISPGHLPNNLTIENVKKGNSNIRNQVLASFATKLLPYRGLGTGIRRALKAYPDIDFDDDREGNLFRVIIKRKELG